jgi:hypothetical protein
MEQNLNLMDLAKNGMIATLAKRSLRPQVSGKKAP